ncbi:MAG: thioredoxin family protein [Nitrospirales bacterium]|nr:thioredoxin family protein [Nitrospirales bacterium]
MLEDVSDENYEGFTQSNAAVVAYGLATCEPCKEYDPIVEEASEQFKNIRFGKAKMHVPGRCRAIKKLHQFATYPTTHFYSKGALLLTKEGKLESSELTELINRYFSPTN